MFNQDKCKTHFDIVNPDWKWASQSDTLTTVCKSPCFTVYSSPCSLPYNSVISFTFILCSLIINTFPSWYQWKKNLKLIEEKPRTFLKSPIFPPLTFYESFFSCHSTCLNWKVHPCFILHWNNIPAQREEM
jgi:hypothetical protein